MEVIGNFTLRHQLAMERLDAKIYVTIELMPSAKYIHSGHGNVTETVEVDLGLHDFAIDISTFVAVTQEAMGNIMLGQLENGYALGCVLSALYDFNVTAMSAKNVELKNPELHGFVSETAMGV